MTESTGGSGLFYYLVVARNTSHGYVGTSGFLLGDRIAPQATGLSQNGVIIVNYAEREPGEPFTVQPSVAKSVWLKFDVKTGELRVIL